MVSKRLIPVAIVGIIGALLIAGSCKGSNEVGDTLYKQQQLMYGVGMYIQSYHYSPKPFDDKFSKEVFQSYLGRKLDPDKSIFLQKNIDSLKVYELLLDDEIKGEVPIRFYPAAIQSFYNQVFIVEALTQKILSQPISFDEDESILLDRDSANFPLDEKDREELWRKRIKYQVLTRYYDLVKQREKANSTDSIKRKSDKQLEAEAREKVQKVMQRYFKRYHSSTTFTKTNQFSTYLNAICEAQDPHTQYMAPLDKADFDAQMSNKVTGIGAQLREDNGDIKIVSIVVGGPAWKSKKIQANDIITKVSTDKEPLIDLSGYELSDAIKLIRGVKGTKVNLEIKKALTKRLDTITLVREVINIDEATARSIIINHNNKRIGYLFLPEFYADFKDDNSRIARDVKTEIQKLKAEGIDGMIVDLRYNPGGSLFDVNQIIG